MKNLLALFCCLFVCWGLAAQCTVNRFCLRFANPAITTGGTQFEFDIVMSSNLDFGLGTSNLQFRYNNAALSSPAIVSTVIAPPLYQPSSITTPFIPSVGAMVGSFNLELNSAGTGQVIPAAGTTICRLRFHINDSNQSSGLLWYYNGGTARTVVFADDETVQLCAVTNDNVCLAPLNYPLSVALPLDLLQFEAHPLQNSIAVAWESKRELNLKGYSLERSNNGFSDFEEITFVPSKGGQSAQAYTYSDQQVVPGIRYYYRLKMLDLDGQFSYSPIRFAMLAGADKEIQLYPNPADDKLHILWNGVVPTTTQVFNMEGQVMLTVSKNTAFESIDVSSLAKGMYYLVVETNLGKSLGYKFVKGE